MLRQGDYFDYFGSIYLVEYVSEASASIAPVYAKHDRLGTVNISLNSEVRIMTKDEAEQIISERKEKIVESKRGRPKGSHNKKVSDEELLQQANAKRLAKKNRQTVPKPKPEPKVETTKERLIREMAEAIRSGS